MLKQTTSVHVLYEEQGPYQLAVICGGRYDARPDFFCAVHGIQ